MTHLARLQFAVAVSIRDMIYTLWKFYRHFSKYSVAKWMAFEIVRNQNLAVCQPHRIKVEYAFALPSGFAA